nr:glycosyltransferase [Acinetobacter sp. Marseille-Q1620]
MPKKKILVLGKRNGILQWFENLIAVRHENPEFEIQGFALNHNNNKERFLKKIHPWKELYTAKLLKKQLHQFQPDLIVIADLFYFNKHLLSVLASSPAKKAHWIGDFFDSRLVESKNIIDLYFFTDSSFIEDAKKIGIDHCMYLPLAYNPQVFYNRNENKSDRMIFIGAWSPDRQELIEQIPIPLTIYGKGWDKLHKPECNIHPYNIDLNQVSILYSRHKYVLNVINKKNIRQGMNMRCFEAPACGCILVSEYVKDITKIFDIEQEIIYFNSPSDLKNKLENDSINPELAKIKVLDHTYSQRLHHIYNKLCNNPKY